MKKSKVGEIVSKALKDLYVWSKCLNCGRVQKMIYTCPVCKSKNIIDYVEE